jgi:hypothetical protein
MKSHLGSYMWQPGPVVWVRAPVVRVLVGKGQPIVNGGNGDLLVAVLALNTPITYVCANKQGKTRVFVIHEYLSRVSSMQPHLQKRIK